MSWESVWSFLGDLFIFLTRNETVAILAPFMVFVITLMLVVRKAIGFFVTVLLLAFSLASGLAIMNYDSVRDWVKNDIPEEHYQELRTLLQDFQGRVLDSLDELQAQLEELEEEKETFQQVATGTAYLLQKIEKQEEKLKGLMEQEAEPERPKETSATEKKLPMILPL